MMDDYCVEVKMNDGRTLAPCGSFQETVTTYIGRAPFNTEDALIPVNVSSFFLI